MKTNCFPTLKAQYFDLWNEGKKWGEPSNPRCLPIDDFWTVSAGTGNLIRALLNWRDRKIKMGRPDRWKMQSKVPERRELCPRKALEICTGIPLSLLLKTRLCTYRTKLHRPGKKCLGSDGLNGSQSLAGLRDVLIPNSQMESPHSSLGHLAATEGPPYSRRVNSL